MSPPVSSGRNEGLSDMIARIAPLKAAQTAQRAVPTAAMVDNYSYTPKAPGA
jgi:hypothetical protein